MTRRPRKCFDDIGDRFDRSLASEEVGFTDTPFNLTIVPVRKRKQRNSSRKYLMAKWCYNG
jgi:hypothetical protein